MKKSHLLFFITLTLGSTVIFAQPDFRPGYVITLEGDTIYGTIDYRSDNIMHTHCRFKDDAGNETDYSPSDIAGFRFTDSKYYIASQVELKDVFLEFLVNGKLNVYYMRDEDGDHYYVDKDSIRLTEVPYVNEIRHVDDRLVYYERKTYIPVLQYFTLDAPQLKSEINNIREPNHVSLIKLAEDYHHAVCNDGSCIVYERKLPLVKLAIEPEARLFALKDLPVISCYGGSIVVWAPRNDERLFVKAGAFLFTELDLEYVGRLGIYSFDLQYVFERNEIQPYVSLGTNFLTINNDNVRDYSHLTNLGFGMMVKLSDHVSLTAGIDNFLGQVSLMIMGEMPLYIGTSANLGIRINLINKYYN